MVMERRLAVELAFLETWVALLLSRMVFWWLVMMSRVPLRRELERMAVHTLKML